jgi:hypothetical protein
MKATPNKKITVGEDMICPVTKVHCDDECCTVGSECNVSGNSIQYSEKEQNIVMCNKITPEALREMGFEKQYADLKGGFWRLNSLQVYFTVDFKTMTPSIHLKGYGHIQKLTNATTIDDIKDLIRLFK